MVSIEEVINGIIYLICFLGVSIGITLLILAFAPIVSNFADRFILFYTTQGLVISIGGYKITRKYYNNKESVKKLFFWRQE